MCGIAGIVGSNRSYEPEVNKMIRSLSHRGPDGQKTEELSGVCLAQSRLSIVDLAGGWQPMHSSTGKTVIVFNGEIYGYKDLREKLSSNYDFQTNSDTEVILAAYEKYGIDFVKNLPGMFAFAIWDKEKEELFVARDRFGEKPFYYAYGKDGEFIFASEIKGILASNLVQPIINRQSLTHYLQYLYINPIETVFKNIFILPASHILHWSKKNVKKWRYWEFPEIDKKISFNDAVDKFKYLFRESVKKQLIADVDAGALLSGGLDSSTVVAVASEFNTGIKTFSVGFGDDINELPFARAVAKKYQTNHTEIQAGDYDVADLIFKMQNIYDEPFADSSNIPTYLVSQSIGSRIRLALSGDGADEILFGYGWYQMFYVANKFNITFGLPDEIVDFAYRAIRKLGQPESVLNKIRAGYFLNHKNRLQKFLENTSYFSQKELEKLGVLPYRVQFGKLITPNDLSRFDVMRSLTGDMLIKTDRAAMNSSLELRAPFLDVDFAEFSLSLPDEYKTNGVDGKRILRKAFSELWPEEIRNRPKQGFGAPVIKWLQLPSVKLLVDKYLNNKECKIFEIISFVGSREIVIKNNYQTWILLNLSIWLETREYRIVYE